MKIQLKNARLSFDANDKRVLSEDELAFITGESAIFEWHRNLKHKWSDLL